MTGQSLSPLVMGLRYSDELTDSLVERGRTMQESTTYQKILREGRDEGQKVDRLETLGERILDPEIHDWAELMQSP